MKFTIYKTSTGREVATFYALDDEAAIYWFRHHYDADCYYLMRDSKVICGREHV